MGFSQCLDRCRLFLPSLEGSWIASGGQVRCGSFWCGAHGESTVGDPWALWRPRTALPRQENKLSEHPGTWVLKEPKLILLGLSYAAFCYFQYLAFFWGNRYVSDILDVAPSTARWIASLMMAFHGIGMVLGGFTHTRWPRQSGSHQVQRTHGLLSLPSAAAAMGLIAVSFEEPYGVIALLALSLAWLGVSEGIFWTQAAEWGGAASGLSPQPS